MVRPGSQDLIPVGEPRSLVAWCSQKKKKKEAFEVNENIYPI